MANETSPAEYSVQEKDAVRHDDEEETANTCTTDNGDGQYEESLIAALSKASGCIGTRTTPPPRMGDDDDSSPPSYHPPPLDEGKDDDDDDDTTNRHHHHHGEAGGGGGRRRNKRHGARNQHKMKHFVRWLLKTFPELLKVERPPPSSATPPHGINENNHDLMSNEQGKEKERVSTSSSSSSSTALSSRPADDSDCKASSTPAPPPSPPPSPPPPLVLDVAGGKGELAARLCLCHHLRVILVDPRPANVAQAYQQVVVPRLPKKWQDRLQQRLVKNPNFVQDVLDQRFRQVVDYFSLQSVVNNNKDSSDKHDENVHQSTTTTLHKAVQEASLLIGMHADGATEDIVNVALQYQKPFVVVPCCVFANIFCHRQVRVLGPEQDDDVDDEELPMTFTSVRTHEQFCQYLLDKDARFQKSILPFEGRNVAIWWDGK